MPELHPIARLLIFGGIGLVVLGILVQVAVGLLPGIGRLPGDIVIERENFKLYIPLGTMILLSVVLSIALNLIARLFNGGGR
ncbi:MAG: DUF2905 domain-containing protein [Thermoflexales bacterium]|nr:DUF2905 domain-containing protein [Thermoflexales bacterium]MDW8351917.1 DUF2905 domain-containing protein [Anaerolineae bacterium]